MENKKQPVIRFIMKLILGGYIIFAGIALQYEMFQERPSDMAWKSAVAVIYIVVGTAYLFYTVRRFVVRALQNRKARVQMEREKEEQLQRERRQAQKRKMLRTAPMPSESEIIQGMARQKAEVPADEEKADQAGKPVRLDEEIEEAPSGDEETDFEEV
jgi:hypothetical protein